MECENVKLFLREPLDRTFSSVVSLKQAFVEIYRHGSRRTSCHAELTCAAPFPVKNHFHLGSSHIERARGANRRAGPALEAFFLIPADILPDALNLDTDPFQVAYTLLEVPPFSAQLQHHQALFPRVDGRFHDIERKIKILYQIYRNRLFDNVFWKSQAEYLGNHGLSPVTPQGVSRATFPPDHSLAIAFHNLFKPGHGVLNDFIRNTVRNSKVTRAPESAARYR